MSPKIAAVIFLALSSVHTEAQNFDSLQSVLSSPGTHDTIRIMIWVDLAYKLQSSHPDSSLAYAMKASTLSEKIRFFKGRGSAARILGNYYNIRTDYIKAIRLYEEGLAFSTVARDFNNVAKCHGNLGVIYANQGSYKKAIDHQLESLKIHERMGNKTGVAYVFNNIAYLYESQSNMAKAREYYLKSLTLLHELKDEPTIAVVELNIGRIYHEEGDYPRALEHELRAADIFEKLKDKHGLTYAFANVGHVFLDLKEYDEAMKYLEKGMREAEQLQASDGIAFIQELYSKYHSSLGNLEEASAFASMAQETARKIGNLERWRNATKQKYQVANKLRRFKEALENYELYIILRDSLVNEKLQKHSLAMEFTMEQERIKMEQEKSHFESEARQERQKRIALMIGGILFLVVGSGIYILVRTFKKVRERELTRVREKISRDLHDRMGSNLSTINILTNVATKNLSSLDYRFKAAEIMGRISEISREALQSVDEIVWSLDPRHSLEEIIARMRLLGGQLEEQDINFFFYVEGSPSDCNLGLEQRNDFYLIYKEAINNICKYSRCKNVTVKLRIVKHQIFLVIADDGVGFRLEAQTKGRGLRNMKLRSENLCGEIKIFSELNQGTRIELEFVA